MVVFGRTKSIRMIAIRGLFCRGGTRLYKDTDSGYQFILTSEDLKTGGYWREREKGADDDGLSTVVWHFTSRIVMKSSREKISVIVRERGNERDRQGGR